jgi:predicted CXXCH cytochrome family protein
MKSLIRTLTLVAVLALPTMALAQGIDGTRHDFGALAWSDNEICGPCHTPHNADGTVTLAPLWAHSQTSATFTTYTSGTMDSPVPTIGGISKLCLSCHDGSVALASYIGNDSGAATKITGTALFGTDLSNDHPISIEYSASGVGLNSSTAAGGGIGGSGTIASTMLFGGNVECASCHDPHDDAGVTNFLREDNQDSVLCLRCHDK